MKIATQQGALLLAAALYGAVGLADEDRPDGYLPDYLDADDPIHIDYDDSLDYSYDAVTRRLTLDGDVRGGYFDADVDNRDGSSDHSRDYTLRLRLGGSVGFSERLRLRGRLAATCTDDDCSPAFENSRTPKAGTNIEDGDVVVDEFHLDYLGNTLAVALGRLQTRSLTRGGVFTTAMTRLTSANVSVNWTDGAMLRYQAENGWTSKIIAQYNDEDGSSTLARRPLDFEDDDSRWSGFYSLESLQRWGPITQRAVDISWMPSALLEDGDTEDYWNIVGRLAAEWPLAEGNSTLILAGQLGYAPETPAESTVGVGTSGDTDGWAGHVDASWMNFLPGHSLGVSYGLADPGWLLSVSFRPNEDNLTLRYHWRPMPGAQLEIQGRWREERDQLVGSLRKRDTFDYRVRLTWAFDSY